MAAQEQEMSYGDGVNKQEFWFKADKPPIVGTCKKLNDGQRLMYRYQFTYLYYLNDKRYEHISISGKEKSVILAARMVDHATNCATCQRERVLEEEYFYGIYK